MPVHFAQNWSISRETDESPILVTFWLENKVQKYCQNIKKTNKLGKKKTQVVNQHKISVPKLTKSSQFQGWMINDGTNIFTFHLNGRDFNPVYSKNATIDSDDDDDYVKMTKEFIQTEEQILNIITPPPKPAIVVEEVQDDLVAQEGWTADDA
jgi:hypothetical protein